MEVTADARLGGGVFRRLLHVVEDGAPTIEFEGIVLTFAGCGAACVSLDDGLSIELARCSTCFPSDVDSQPVVHEGSDNDG
ncbi:hypothetical protein LWC34_41835 [Kibdelosporangium philippinense]|uniref:Uncharacterized protein n=1 Tax=Kibdelosporangium philippinense TaxID=211113 RepID=A0ABS8ZU12_9PSEU|nr:hypothetical protein [Kibdelosporangium philippinense]MCE7009312.1 hypothetical protein [Kibdelosporangium philippinense]